MNGSAASGLMTLEGTRAEPRLPVTGLINDYVTVNLTAAGASAALVKRATGGGSWRVTVNLTAAAMGCGSLGLVDPALAGSDAQHTACAARRLMTPPARSAMCTCSPRRSSSHRPRPAGLRRSWSRGALPGRSRGPDQTVGAWPYPDRSNDDKGEGVPCLT
jgi:crotonobetainyl-CoA:carnitine CoA-transferase CaiB-like acyl-CoA transferase